MGGRGGLVGGLCFVRYFANASPYLGQFFMCRVKTQDGGHCQNKWPLRLKPKGPLFLECPQPRSLPGIKIKTIAVINIFKITVIPGGYQDLRIPKAIH